MWVKEIKNVKKERKKNLQRFFGQFFYYFSILFFRGVIESLAPSEKVIWQVLPRLGAPDLCRRGLEYLEVAVEVLVELEDRGDVGAAVAVVWRGPHRDEGLVEHVLVPLHDQLVRAADQLQPVGPVELLDNVPAKHVPGHRGEGRWGLEKKKNFLKKEKKEKKKKKTQF
jgi:hypothetical protein